MKNSRRISDCSMKTGYLKFLYRNDNSEGLVLMMHNKLFIEKNDPHFVIYSTEKHKSLKNFILREYPYDSEFLNDKVESIYRARGFPRAVLFTPFVNRTEQSLKYAMELRALGKKFKDQVSFYLQDADSRTTRKYKLEGDASYIIFDTDVEKSKYRYTDKVFNGSVDANALIDFTQKFIEKKVPKYIRSSDINPDDLTEPVYPVVAKTYNEVVMDTKKHVFIRYFDKMMQRFPEQFQMRKEWWKVGKNYKNNTRDILIAEIETNDNDILDYFSKEMSAGHHYFLFTKKQKKIPYVYKDNINSTEIIAFAEKIIAQEESTIKTDL